MTAVRRLLAQRYYAILVCAAVLMLRLLVPSGYMIDSAPGHVGIVQCPGMMPRPAPPTMPGMPGPGMHGTAGGHGAPQDHATPEQPCAFAGLSAAALGAVDAPLLALLLAFVMAIGLAPVVLLIPTRSRHLRPPLRGPPATP